MISMPSYSSADIPQRLVFEAVAAMLCAPRPTVERPPFKMHGYRLGEDGTVLEVYDIRGYAVTLRGSEIPPEVRREIEHFEKGI